VDFYPQIPLSSPFYVDYGSDERVAKIRRSIINKHSRSQGITLKIIIEIRVLFIMWRTMGGLNLSVAYTYGSSRDDSSDRFDATLVNSFNLRSNYAASNFDQRQLLNVSYIYDLPSLAQGFGSFLRRFYQSEAQLNQPYSASGLMHRLFDNWQFSGITTAQSGTPFSVINGGSAVNGISVLDNAGVESAPGPIPT
jgi:hypothetical protein